MASRDPLSGLLCWSRWACLIGLLLLGACASTRIPGDGPGPELRFAFGGDIAGQNVCRDREHGLPVFAVIQQMQPDFFVALGDMIYADNLCQDIGFYGNAQIPRATGHATTPREFRDHWQYVHADPAFANLLATMPYFAVWDDHEVRNDFGPDNDLAAGTDDLHLLPIARGVFAELHDMDADRLFFSHRYDDRLEMFFLDTRSYRDANSRKDDPARPKTMLGDQQKSWLVNAVASSSATWKILVSSVPLSIPTGWPPENGRDGWANFDQETGFEHELIEILRSFAKAGVRNIVFISADVHFASGFVYSPFAEHPEFVFHEFVTGPLNAGLFPHRDYDLSLKPKRLFFYGPESAEAITDFASARRWFNFGLISIDASQKLGFELINGYGEVQARLVLEAE